MSWGFVAVAAATVVSGAMASSGAKKAASTQSEASAYAADLQYEQWRQGNEQQKPWRDAGEAALNKLIPLSEYKKFSMDDFQQDPGYAFRLSEGQKALNQNAAARGGLISGNALKAATRYGQDMGSQEYQNAFNRYQAERASQLQPLQSLAGVGQTTANQMAASGNQMAQNVGEIGMQGANARASGYIGSANAVGSTVNSLGNLYGQYSYLNKPPVEQPAMNTGSPMYSA